MELYSSDGKAAWAAAGFSVGVIAVLAVKTLPPYFRLLRFAAQGKSMTKLVLITRTDLNMGRGKIASQCAHAALKCYREASVKDPGSLKLWELSGQPKIVLRARGVGESCLLDCAKEANSLGLVTSIIRDAGRTQIREGTVTVVGIGPGSSELIDKVTGDLSLL